MSAYNRAASFASGHCTGRCATDGWWADLGVVPGNAQSECRGNCVTRGWTTTFPDGTVAHAECNRGDCMKHGWKTFFADDRIGTTTCDSGDCRRYGWVTSLPPGDNWDCECGGTCEADGAHCRQDEPTSATSAPPGFAAPRRKDARSYPHARIRTEGPRDGKTAPARSVIVSMSRLTGRRSMPTLEEGHVEGLSAPAAVQAGRGRAVHVGRPGQLGAGGGGSACRGG